MKNVLITGSAGYVGKNLKKFINQKNTNYKFFYTDIHNLNFLDRHKVKQFLKSKKIHTIIHLGVLQNVSESFDKPSKYINTNIIGTSNLLEFATMFKVKRFIFLSSITVHGSNNETVNEESSINPNHVYGATKAGCEALIKSFSNRYNLEYFILRPNLIIGNNKNMNQNFFDYMFKEIKNENTYTLFGDGKHKRDWIHVLDVCSAIILLLKNKKCKNLTFALGNNKYSFLSVAKKIAKKFPKSKPIFKKANNQTFSLTCSSSKIKSKIGWQPKFNMEKIVNEYYERYK